MRSRTPPDAPGRCLRCWVLLRFCACDVLQPVPAKTPFLVVRHARESPKSTNSVRWACLVLPRCEVLDYRSRAEAASLAVTRPGDCLLYPEESAAALSPIAVQRVIVLDGTWRQTRRMLRALPGLAELPRLAVPPRPAGRRLRAAPKTEALSTLEAMAGAVRVIESEALADDLLRIHDALVERVLRARGRPGREQAA